MGGDAARLEVATDQGAYIAKRGRRKADRTARLDRVRGALAMPDGRWVSWDRDSVRLGARPGGGPRVGPPLDVPRVAAGDRHHAVIWDSAIVVRDARPGETMETLGLGKLFRVFPDDDAARAHFAG